MAHSGGLAMKSQFVEVIVGWWHGAAPTGVCLVVGSERAPDGGFSVTKGLCSVRS